MYASTFVIFMVWTNPMFSSAIPRSRFKTTERITLQHKLHEVQSKMIELPMPHHDHEELEHDNEDRLPDSGNEDIPEDTAGLKATLAYGAPCAKTNPQACKKFPEVTCVWVEENTFLCRCDFQHTWNSTSEECIANVFAPCSELKDCGSNMECRPDSIGSNPNVQMCRCVDGYEIETDADGLPALCVEIVPESETPLPAHAPVVRTCSFTTIMITNSYFLMTRMVFRLTY